MHKADAFILYLLLKPYHTLNTLLSLVTDDSVCYLRQASEIALVRSYLQVPQAAGQVKILIFLVKINFFPIYANNFCDAGQVPILRYFKACKGIFFIPFFQFFLFPFSYHLFELGLRDTMITVTGIKLDRIYCVPTHLDVFQTNWRLDFYHCL